MMQYLTLDEWQAYVESHPQSTVFHHRNWIELLRHQYGTELLIPAICDAVGGRIIAAVPLLETKSLLGKPKLVSLPFTDALPLLADDADSAVDLRCELRDHFRDSYRAVILRSDDHAHVRCATRDSVRHEIDTSQPLEAITGQFTRQTRQSIRKAERSGLAFSTHTDRNAVRDFYQLHIENRHRIGSPVQPERFFLRLHEHMIESGLGFVAFVSDGTQRLSGGIILHYNQTVTFKFLASQKGALGLRPNDLLTAGVIQFTAEHGYRCLDFGISHRNQIGLRRFKKKFGAQEIDVVHDHVAGKVSKRMADSSSLKTAALVIKTTPAIVCKTLGEALYPYSQ